MSTRRSQEIKGVRKGEDRAAGSPLALNTTRARELIAELMRGLDDPTAPSACTICIFLFETFSMHQSVRSENIRLLRTEYAPFLSKIMMVLAVNHCDTSSSDQTLALDSAMRNCCSQSPGVLHTALSAEIPPGECTNAFISSLCSLVNSCFPTISRRAIQKARFKFSTLWPTGPHDLLPRGPDSFRGLIHWLPVVRHEAAISTLIRVFLWCRPAFYIEFSKDESRRLLMQAICDILDSVTVGFRQHLDDDDPGNLLASLSEFLDYVPKFGLDEWMGWRSFLCGFENELLSSISSVLVVCPAELSHMRSQLRRFAFHVHASLGIESLREMSETTAYHMFHDQIACGGSIGHFRRLLRSLSERRSCSAPECPHSVYADRNSPRLLVCGSCKVVRYCSKECQLQHWHSRVRPHKLTCRLLKPIVARAPPTADFHVFEMECRLMGLDVDQLSVIYDGLTGHRYHDPPDGEESGILKYLKETDFLHDFHASLAEGTANLPEFLKQLDALGLEHEVQTQLSRYVENEMALKLGVTLRQVALVTTWGVYSHPLRASDRSVSNEAMPRS